MVDETSTGKMSKGWPLTEERDENFIKSPLMWLYEPCVKTDLFGFDSLRERERCINVNG